MQEPYQHPYEYQSPPFGHSRDEGTIEEHITRRVNKRLDRSRSPRDIFDKTPGKAPLITGLAGIVLAAITLTMFLVWKGSAENQISQAETQISEMRNQLASVTQQLQAAQNRQNVQSANYAGLSGKMNALGALVGTWNLTCAQALESQNGPGTYYFPCSSVKP